MIGSQVPTVLKCRAAAPSKRSQAGGTDAARRLTPFGDCRRRHV
jgi:hypothetical protein